VRPVPVPALALARGRLGDALEHRGVVVEELTPRLADRLGVAAELFVHLLDEPRVGPETRRALIS